MTNKTAHDVTDDDRRLARKWAEDIESDMDTWSDRARAAARVILHAVPTPPTLAPALPDGWRLADHQTRGRVIVTNPTPNRDGHVYFVHRAADRMGCDWHRCDPSELTYIDQEAEDVTPVKVGDVIESAADPRLAALPVGSVLIDCDRETVAKRSEEWVGLGYIPIESEGEEFGPWTVRRIGLEADQ